MTQPHAALLLLALGLWLGALATLGVADRILFRRHGDAAWPAVRTLGAAVDLLGTWLGALAALLLLLGRRGYGAPWAVAVGLVALMVTAALYDRAVLIPSLDAAWKRRRAAAEDARWEGEWRFLRRMAAAARYATLGAGAGAAVAALLA